MLAPVPCSWFCVVSHWLCRPCEQVQQLPQHTLNGTTTRSPTLRSFTPGPTSSTMPIDSWPMTSPAFMNGASGS
jgi:hypothetical protein